MINEAVIYAFAGYGFVSLVFDFLKQIKVIK